MKWLQVLLFNTNYSIQRDSFICTQLNGSKYCYVLITIKYQAFVHTHLNDQTILFLAIKFS